MQVQISWLLQKPTDLDLHCLQNRVYPVSARQGLKTVIILYKLFINVHIPAMSHLLSCRECLWNDCDVVYF